MVTKLHMCLSSEYHVIEGFLTGGEVHDVVVSDELTKDVTNSYVLEDRGYDSDSHRQILRSNNNTPVIPGRRSRKTKIIYDENLYQLRSRVEMFFGKIKENRRLAVRYDKSDLNFLSFIAVACIKIFMRMNMNLC